jgi:hypothetical protein
VGTAPAEEAEEAEEAAEASRRGGAVSRTARRRSAASAGMDSGGIACIVHTANAIGCEYRDVRGFGWEIAHGAVT